MDPNQYGLDGKPLSCRDLKSDPVTGLSSPNAAARSDPHCIDTTIGLLVFSGLFIGLVCFLVSKADMFN